MKRNQSLLQTVFAKLWSIPALTNVATKDNPADAGKRGMSAEILQLSSWVEGPHFLTSSHTVRSLTTSVKKQINPVPSIFPFDKFSSYQKYLRIAAYVLRLLPKHAG